ncbi:MAG: sugar ABC transporter permease [Treponema sp.]|jgi:ABC-type sugar transport system permease subunit|nr:sugar ABC transporter permease [Treponema sp.]
MKKNAGILPYVLILPFLFSFLLFFAFPAVYSLVLSFYSYRGYGIANFVAFDNYKALLSYGSFWRSVGNTFFYFLAHVIPVMAGALLYAVALHSKAVGGLQKIFKPIIFLPQVVPVMATALIFRIVFATRSGAFNQIFGSETRWLEDASIMRWVVVLIIIWRATGWFVVVFVAGLTTISNDLYEAAMLDGASAAQKLVFITIPLMRPFFLFAFVMDAISSLKIYTEPNILWPTQNRLPTDVAPMMNMITTNLRGGQFGMASAAGWLLFFVVLVISLLELYLLRDKERPK